MAIYLATLLAVLAWLPGKSPDKAMDVVGYTFSPSGI